jgi:hypothetical protein
LFGNEKSLEGCTSKGWKVEGLVGRKAGGWKGGRGGGKFGGWEVEKKLRVERQKWK